MSTKQKNNDIEATKLNSNVIKEKLSSIQGSITLLMMNINPESIQKLVEEAVANGQSLESVIAQTEKQRAEAEKKIASLKVEEMYYESFLKRKESEELKASATKTLEDLKQLPAQFELKYSEIVNDLIGILGKAEEYHVMASNLMDLGFEHDLKIYGTDNYNFVHLPKLADELVTNMKNELDSLHSSIKTGIGRGEKKLNEIILSN